jgi:excisionase family DNA binding protein
LLSAEHNPEEGHLQWAFSRPALTDCREKVFKYVENCSSQAVDEKNTFVDLIGAARILFVVGLNAVAILRRVSEGKLPAYYIAGQKLNLGLLLFKRSDIEQCIETIKSENRWLGREALTKLLRVKDVTLTRWVRVGLILPAAICGGAQYFDQEAVEKFISDHITTEEAVKILGIGKLTVQKWARQGRLSSACISGPHIDGYHSYIFHRGKLIRWRSERITFGETARQLGVSNATLHRWVQEGKLEPLHDMGGEHRWFSARVIQMLQEKTNKGSI